MKLQFTALSLPANQLGESPFWHTQEQRLYWCDIKQHLVHAFNPATRQHEQWRFESEPGCIAPADDGRIAVALRDCVQLLNPRTDARETISRFTHDTTKFRSNDGKCDAMGRFWIGSVFEPKDAEIATLWKLEARNHGYQLQAVISNNITSNGLAFSTDNVSAYWAHTAQHRVDVMNFDLARGELSHRRPWIAFPSKTTPEQYGGRPDGAVVDAEGCYWTAMYEGGCLLRISPAAEVLSRIEVPTRYPTMPCFGGADLRTLYLTSAKPSSSVEDGLIYCAQVDVAGQEVARFRVCKP